MSEEEKKQLRDLEYKKTQSSGGLTAGEVTSLTTLKDKSTQHVKK